MNLARARLAAVVALPLVVAVLAGCSDSSSTKELRVGYQDIPNGGLIVKHERWLEESVDRPVRWERFDSGASVNKAIADKRIDVGLVGSTGFAAGVSAKLPYRAVWIYDVIGQAEALVARSGTGIKSVKDLLGKSVGVPFGSTSHYALLAALAHEDISPSDVTIVDLEPRDILDAWQSRRIDAAYIWDPTLSRLKDDGGSVVIDSAQLAARGQITADLGVATTALIDKEPKLVQAWVDAENRAVTMIQDKPEQAAAAIGAELDLSDRDVRRQFDGYRFLTAAEQVTQDYLGTAGDPGRLVGQLTRAAVFQHDYPQTAKFGKDKVYSSEPTRQQFEKAVDPEFAVAAEKAGR